VFSALRMSPAADSMIRCSVSFPRGFRPVVEVRALSMIVLAMGLNLCNHISLNKRTIKAGRREIDCKSASRGVDDKNEGEGVRRVRDMSCSRMRKNFIPQDRSNG